MRRLSLRLTVVLLVLCATLVVPMFGTVTNAAPEKTFVGFISNNHCGLKHMKGMGDDKACTLMCVDKGGKFVLADRDHKRVYQLDKTGQEKARDFAGQKVKITGRVTGRTIHVTNIEAAG